MFLLVSEGMPLVQLRATCHHEEGQSPTLWQGLEPVFVWVGEYIFRDSSTLGTLLSPN